MKNKIIILFLILSTMFFGNLVTDKRFLLKSIYEGNNFTNISPYPIKMQEEEDIYTYYYKNLNPFWIIVGNYITDWSDFERGLYLSDSLPYVNGITGGYDSNSIKITFGIYPFEPYLNNKDWLIQKNGSIDGNSDRVGMIGYTDLYKTFVIHRIEFKSFEFLRVAFNEINLVGGKFPDLVDINPFSILHNTFGEGYSNAMLGADISFIPIKGMQLYSQFAMDDFVVPATEAGAVNYKPTSLAYAFGGRYVFKNKNYFIAPKFEIYKIYTWIYNRWQKLLKFTANYNGLDIPMGFDHGNDMQGVLIGIDIFNDSIKSNLLFEYYQKGEIDLNTPYDDERKTEYENWSGPYGKTKNIFIISFNIELEL